MHFDLAQVPFSRYGSYIAFSQLGEAADRPAGLYLRSVHGSPPRSEGRGEVFRLEGLIDGQPLPFTESASPACLHLEHERGNIEICMPEAEVVRVRGQGAGLRLSTPASSFADVVPRAGDRWQVARRDLQVRYRLSPLAGTLAVDAPWSVDGSAILLDFLPDGETGMFEAVIEENLYGEPPRPHPEPFDACLESIEALVAARSSSLPPVPSEYCAAAELAGYITWSSVVEPQGLLKRPALLASRNNSVRLESQDHVFNALALANDNPTLAWDQFLVAFDHQPPSGALPDSVSDRGANWMFCQPPLQGWALRRLMRHADWVDDAKLAEIYDPLGRWTQWWFGACDDDRDGIPQYNHGSDSGWDNASIFTDGPLVESPDLSAYLVVQMDALAEVATRLGRPAEAKKWEARANALLYRLFDHAWRGDCFVALQSGTHTARGGDSLILFMPLVLGERLPKPILSKLVAGLSRPGRFLTDHGLASESLASPLYESNGNWRGPIQAAPTVLLVDGLTKAGETDLARDIAHRFCQMAAHSGMAECFAARTGVGLGDHACTVTASVFLLLASQYLID